MENLTPVKAHAIDPIFHIGYRPFGAELKIRGLHPAHEPFDEYCQINGRVVNFAPIDTEGDMAVHIDQCAFGRMTIDGRIYTRDLMIFPDGQIIDGWWRKTGHRFSTTDIQPLVDAHPEIIVAGTGINGMVQVSVGLEIALSQRGIDLQAFKTQSAASVFNRLATAGKHVAGCFHLTC